MAICVTGSGDKAEQALLFQSTLSNRGDVGSRVAHCLQTVGQADAAHKAVERFAQRDSACGGDRFTRRLLCS